MNHIKVLIIAALSLLAANAHAQTYEVGDKITSRTELQSAISAGNTQFFIFNCAGDEDHHGFVYSYSNDDGAPSLAISHDNRTVSGFETTDSYYGSVTNRVGNLSFLE